jgi:proline racemase
MMDATLSAMMLADALAMCAEAGQTVTIAGTAFPAMVSDPTLAPTLEAGGLMERVSTLVKLPTTSGVIAIKASCQPGKKLTFDGRVFRVTAFTTKPGSAWYQLQCQDADQH